jgi:hypothetical protein
MARQKQPQRKLHGSNSTIVLDKAVGHQIDQQFAARWNRERCLCYPKDERPSGYMSRSAMSTPHLTSLEVDGWMIHDAEVAYAENPQTYWIPPLAERQSVNVSGLVKIRFYIRVQSDDGEVVDHGERMWVIIHEHKNGWYRGKLDNDPYCTNDIRAGLEVWFQPRHIIAIHQG